MHGVEDAITSWPGLQMSLVEGTTDIYIIQITHDMKHYLDHNYIIFNDDDYSGSEVNLTTDTKINPFEVNNKLYSLDTYNVSGKKRIYVKVVFGDSPVYVYLWNTYDESIKNADWPGVDISQNKISDAGYYVILDDNKYTHIIINNGHGSQTQDLEIPIEQDMTLVYQGRNSYFDRVYRLGNWSNYLTPQTMLPSHSN